MITSDDELKKIAALAHINLRPDEAAKLKGDLAAILNFVDTLRSMDTSLAAPFIHPLEMTQRLRPDKVTEANQLKALEIVATVFADGLYLVPKVIETGS